MSRVTALIYGILMVLVALDAMIFGIIPSALLPFLVILLGLLVLITPLASSGQQIYPGVQAGYPGMPRPAYQWLRRWVFGIYLVLSGLFSFTSLLNFPYGAFSSIYTFSGQLILLLIGAISILLFSARTRNIQINSY